MKRWKCGVLCAVLAALLCLPVSAGEKAVIQPHYTPSTQKEARCIPLNLQQGYFENGELTQETWHTLYNPETASMMVELADASTSMNMDGDFTKGHWDKIMAEYGYEQLYNTYNNVTYKAKEFRLGWRMLGELQQPIWFPAVNAMIGIQEVEYNGKTRYAVGIVFRGSSDAQDWLADFTAYSDWEGYHEGFSQNAAYFYEVLSKEVIFHVGNKYYSLYEIYDQMKQPDSEFCMLVMGHSLGGALTNVLVGRYLYEHGVHPSNLAGYGFAVPRTAPDNKVKEYPYHNIYNIINADDLVPAITLMGHERFGEDLVYYPDDTFRLNHYGRSYVENNLEQGNSFWRTIGFVGTLAKPHLIDACYRDIVASVSADIAANTEETSKYTTYSTRGYNNWWSADTVISPYTFGDFKDNIRSGGMLMFRDGGVLQTTGDLYTVNGLMMHHEDDYLLVKGDLDIAWGVLNTYPEHLTAGTVEIRGDFTTDNFNFYEYSYRETGTHRTVLSGTGKQVLSFHDEDVRFQNLYLRNPLIEVKSYIPYLRLAEDGVITATDTLVAWEMDLNGHQLGLAGNLHNSDLTMSGGTLQVGGNAAFKIVQPMDGKIAINGSLEMSDTLPFAGGQMWVEGDCYLPSTMIMQNEEDYLCVGKTLTLFAREWDEIPDDHLSAGTVELKGDLTFDDCGTCSQNGYRETGSHKTILSGTGPQTIWFNRANNPNRFENLCIRNPQTSLYMLNDTRLGEDAAITVTGGNRERRVVINGTLDTAEHTMTVDASGWIGTAVWPVEIGGLKSSAGGSLQVTGPLHITGGEVAGKAIVTGNVLANGMLNFAGGQLEVGGNCEAQISLRMQNDADYLLVWGDLILHSDYKLTEGHLSAGTIELKGDLFSNSGNGHPVFWASGTHRLILSGTELQDVKLIGGQADRVMQVCLRNPNVVVWAHTLRLMEDGAIADASQCNIYGNIDLNGHSLAVQGQFNILRGGIVDSSADENGSASGGLVQLALAEDTCTVNIARPVLSEAEETAFETVNILFTGYNGDRMVVCQPMSFTSQSQLSATLDVKNWPQCDRIQVFLLEGDYAPFCREMIVPMAR